MRINLGWLKAAETTDVSRQLEKSVQLWLTGVHLRYHPVLRLRLQVLGLFDSTQLTALVPAGVWPVPQSELEIVTCNSYLPLLSCHRDQHCSNITRARKSS